jgi:hypothetical protein
MGIQRAFGRQPKLGILRADARGSTAQREDHDLAGRAAEVAVDYTLNRHHLAKPVAGLWQSAQRPESPGVDHLRRPTPPDRPGLGPLPPVGLPGGEDLVGGPLAALHGALYESVPDGGGLGPGPVEAADGLAKGLTEGGPDPGREVAAIAAAAAVLLLGPGPLQQLPRPAGSPKKSARRARTPARRSAGLRRAQLRACSPSMMATPPDRAPVGWRDRGRVRPSGAGRAGDVGGASGGGKVERILAPSDRAAVTKDTKLR